MTITKAPEHTRDRSHWSGRAVLVTGATGFVGSLLAAALADAGARVTCLVRDEPHPSNFDLLGLADRVNVAHGELENEASVERALLDYQSDTVFHLAAQTLVGAAQRGPALTFDSNIRGTWNLLEACRKLGGQVRAIVVASSDKAYGVHEKLPYREDFPLQPRFPYDVSKACADLISRTYFYSYGLPVAVTRCANIYGGGDLNWSRIVPGTIRAALEGTRPIIRSDGSPQRDYLYVDDAVDAYLALARAIERPGVAGAAFNFGTDRPIAVLPLVKAILSACSREDLEADVRGTATAEIDRQYLDSTRAREVLQWTPQVELQDGLQRAVAWYSQRASHIFR